jgi:hypothetical protein
MEILLTALSVQLHGLKQGLNSWFTNVGKLLVDLGFNVTASVRVFFLDRPVGGLFTIELGSVLRVRQLCICDGKGAKFDACTVHSLLETDRADLRPLVLLSSWRKLPRCLHHQG